MSPEQIGLAGMAALIGLIALGCPVGLAMIAVGAGGFAAVVGVEPALRILERGTLETVTNYSFTVIPLFILMGAMVARAGLSRDLFLAARRLTWRMRGGLAVAGLGASAAFAAVSGSSLATASTMTRVAYPEMRAHGYDARLSAGSLAAGGTLGIMIPPSVALLLYALITEQSVGTMFLAGVIPGLLGFALYAAAAMLAARAWRTGAEAGPEGSLGLALRRMLPVAVLFGLVMGGLYGGVFTPTEAGGAGAALALVLALGRGLGWRGFNEALAETAALSASLFVILIGAEVFGFFLSVSRLSFGMAAAVEAAGLTPLQVILAILVFYLVLGCFMESLAMILLSVPVFFPLVEAAGLDPVWFGILAVTTVEVGLITPPVGMNLFVVNAAAGELSLSQIWRGILPFVAADIVRLGLLVAFPALSLWLPHLFGG
ncbi:TRAP transporter large permease [Limibaculum sp. M0105]|uniref:TRAP transporter large permease protein n=1 Tax=Thermohalobaculum xanthum TaxID=2753746 RepID=A0A8J7MB29_9RHOB|nr:TRAP transporter large permease [Thermohalobaculum xanthum]MBK0401115.1 TRAP transporter large permease [Thermohalobaculum xanthum]